MFGDDIMVVPIVGQMNPNISMVDNKTIWVPPGKWIEENSGELFTGPMELKRNWDLSEMPRFI